MKPGNHEFPGEQYKFQVGICKWYMLDFHLDFQVIVAGIQGVFAQNASWIFRHTYMKCFIFLCIKKYSCNRFSECFILFLGDES